MTVGNRDLAAIPERARLLQPPGGVAGASRGRELFL